MLDYSSHSGRHQALLDFIIIPPPPPPPPPPLTHTLTGTVNPGLSDHPTEIVLPSPPDPCHTTPQRKQLGRVSDFLYKRKGHSRRETKTKVKRKTKEKDTPEKTRRSNKEQAVIKRRQIGTTNQGLIRTEHMTKTKTTRPRTNHT